MRRLVTADTPPIESDIVPTRLYTTRRDVSDLNKTELDKLGSSNMQNHVPSTEILPIDPLRPLEKKPEKRVIISYYLCCVLLKI